MKPINTQEIIEIVRDHMPHISNPEEFGREAAAFMQMMRCAEKLGLPDKLIQEMHDSFALRGTNIKLTRSLFPGFIWLKNLFSRKRHIEKF